ncbi:MAG TPA: TMEM165/GDT1 family protein [Allosphingosinicella sp.]
MEPLLTTFIAAALAEWGDKTQLLVAALGARYRRPAPILAGIAVAALANSALAAFGGTYIHGVITPRAVSLLVAMALLLAGGGGFFRSKTPDMGAGWRVGPFLTTAACFFLLEFGDKTQFVTAALAAQFGALALAALGAAAGILASSVPAAVLGARFAAAIPLRGIRIAAGVLFLLAGLVIAVNALRLA